MSAARWPQWVYREGEEPDYRFSFANERTFLAWIRTGVALLAAGAALSLFGEPSTATRCLAAVLVAAGALSAGSSWFRWARAERALRRSEPLPGGAPSVLLAATVLIAGVIVALKVV